MIIVRYFHNVVSDYLVKEIVDWRLVDEDDGRGVELSGFEGKWLWVLANTIAVILPLLPDIDDENYTSSPYWDYYNLPINPAFVEITEEVFLTMESDRAVTRIM